MRFPVLNRAVLAASVLLLMLSGISIAEQPAKTITIHAKRFAFDPAEITVKKGEEVKLSLVSDDVPHSLVVKELNINAPIAKNKPTEISFTPEKTGDFKGVCGRFCGTGHGSMKFMVHVTE
jgi:cytochrome c oxidase subunit II